MRINWNQVLPWITFVIMLATLVLTIIQFFI